MTFLVNTWVKSCGLHILIINADDVPSIGTEGKSFDLVGMPLPYPQAHTAFHLPEADMQIIAGAGQLLAIGAEGKGVDLARLV